MKVRIPPIPDETYFLCMLHNIGATIPERSLSIEEIAVRTAMDPSKVEENLRKLAASNYIEARVVGGTKRYHVTLNGIRKVLSMYS